MRGKARNVQDGKRVTNVANQWLEWLIAGEGAAWKTWEATVGCRAKQVGSFGDCRSALRSICS